MMRHHRWVRDSGVGSADRNVFEHEVLSLILHHACKYDLMNIGNVACLEVASRSLQLIEEAVAENPSMPSREGAHLFTGTDERRWRAIMAPALRAFVATELGPDAAIQKEKRNAREAKGGKGGRGRGDPEKS